MLLIIMMTALGVDTAVADAAVTKTAFGKLPDGTTAEIYTLKNEEIEVRIANYGARIVAI